MRIANVAGRVSLVIEGAVVDVEMASGGRFGPDSGSVFAHWAELRRWAESYKGPVTDVWDESRLQAPVGRPGQIFAIGLNYADHAAESDFAPPADPVVFTKFASSLTGPRAVVRLPADTVDWEAELVVVIGASARNVPERKAWDVVAGLTVGQDLSERAMQHRGPAPQFGLAKSFPGFSPVGPVLVTPDELPDRDDLAIGCAVDGETLQSARTSQMIFPVPELIARLSAILPLAPGDVIFTGTPSGVGAGRKPPRYLRAGQRLRTWVEGIGEIEQEFAAADGDEEFR